jgi:FtsP/CotA-like multicopper oxidase with cupredoxin domain
MHRRVGLALALAWLVACAGRGSGPLDSVPPLSDTAARAAHSDQLPEPPVVRAVNSVVRLTLTAVENPIDGQPTFSYQGSTDVIPNIDVKPGQTIDVKVVNDLPVVPPPGADVSGAMAMPDGMAVHGTGRKDDMNLHFHGLGSSPKRPGDDVLTMLALPGQTLHYVVHVPANQEPGLYWYHPHVHGQTSFQVGDSGMSGAIVVEGLERHLPGLAGMKQRVIIVRSTGIGADALPAHSNVAPCATKDHLTTTLNGAYRPTIEISPGEKQFWRVVNATGHKTLRLNVEGELLELVAIDGFALDSYPGTPPTKMLSSIVVPPASRAEFVVTGPASGHARFRTLCYDTGPNGDPDPEILLGRLNAPQHSDGGDFSKQPLRVGAPLPRNAYTTALPPPAAKRLVVFSENNKPHFFINGRSFDMKAPPMFVVHVGTVEEWQVENVTDEIHDFHIHQTHFIVESIDGVTVAHPHWADSTVIPHSRIVDGKRVPGQLMLLMDFRDPLIRGEFVFHCHILDHEDQGMMAKIEAI